MSDDAVDPDSPPTEADRSPTWFLDSDHPDVADFARRVTAGAPDDAARAAALFLAVRDGIRYDPYDISRDPADHRAHAVLAGRQRWCVPKAVLLAATARAVDIPSRLGFADVRNHLQSERLRERMGTDLFPWHGYAVLWIDGAWRKCSPAFNREMCERFGTPPLDFDGTADALLHAFTADGQRYMEYLVQRGTYSDLPLERIFASFADLHGGGAAPATTGA